jgi:hypothetical protein
MDEHAIGITDTKRIHTQSGYVTYSFSDVPFKVAKLTYELFENESFQYVFEPYYDVIDGFDHLDIPGLDLSLRKPVYFRVNMTPVFVSERVPPKNRANLRDELKEEGLDYYSPFLFLLDSKRTYGGDRLSLKSQDYYDQRISRLKDTDDIYKTISNTLRRLAARLEFKIGSLQVNEANRTVLIRNYIHLYALVGRHYDDRSKGGKGRRKHDVSWIALEEAYKLHSNGVITIEEAVNRSGLNSKRTYYRRVKEMRDNK